MAEPVILLTNDDGIDSVGFRRLYEELADVGDVTAVAPAANRSAVGRSIDPQVGISDHELGYAIEGTPAACVVCGLTALDIEPDLVVSGINKGANLGEAVLGRSGTVAAAIEAAYMNVPAIAVSMYIPFDRIEGDFHGYTTEPKEFDAAAATTRRLVELADGGRLFDIADYFNVNAPISTELAEPTIRVTRPAPGYHTEASRDGDALLVRDRQFERIYSGEFDMSPETDRGTVATGRISVSPLTLPSQGVSDSDLTALAEDLEGRLETGLTRE